MFSHPFRIRHGTKRTTFMLFYVLKKYIYKFCKKSMKSLRVYLYLNLCIGHAFVPTSKLNLNYKLHSSNDEYNDYDDHKEAQNRKNSKRMEIIRSLQDTYYKDQMDDEEKVCFQNESFEVFNLPLWRVNWWELPGRTNVLSVHEGIYTHMFERLIRRHDNLEKGDSEWYSGMFFGHLFRSSASSSSDQLCSYQDITSNPDDSTGDNPNAEVIGTLMRVVDYRRRVDGKLLLLVQALDRFVVTKVVQSVPYGIANVKIIPDVEEIRKTRTFSSSFKFMNYEHDPKVVLPLPLSSDLSVQDVYGPSIAMLMPYTTFSNEVSELFHCYDDDIKEDNASTIHNDDIYNEDKIKETIDLELVDCLLSKNVLYQNFYSHPEISTTSDDEKLTCDELELQVWTKLHEFQIVTGKVLPSALLSLLPTEPSKNSNRMSNIVHNIPYQLVEQVLETMNDKNICLLHHSYPAYRRQKRLSYTAAGILEHFRLRDTQDFRKQLLSFASTKDRLRFISEQLELLNTSKLNEFA